MRSGNGRAALALLLALLTGCGPKPPRTTVSVAAQVPSLPPSRMIAILPPLPPVLPPTARPTVKLDTTTPPETRTEVATTPAHHSTKHHSKPATDEPSKTAALSAPQSAAQTTQNATAQPPEMTPIGPLSTANNNSNAADRHALSDLIDSTENGVNAIKRPLSSDEQKTVVLIRSYITRARDALKADDLDGAKTLGDKAHQMLQELTKQ
jgi:hypothetical protein